MLDLGDDALPPVLRAKRDNPEHRLQCACWRYACDVLPENADYASVETKMGYDNRHGALQRKAAGVRAGEPDARVVWQGRVLFIEFKAGAGVSAQQRIRHEQIRRARANVVVIRSVCELAIVFERFEIPLRFHAVTPATRDAALERHTAVKKPRKASKPYTPKPGKRRLAAGTRMALAMARGRG